MRLIHLLILCSLAQLAGCGSQGAPNKPSPGLIENDRSGDLGSAWGHLSPLSSNSLVYLKAGAVLGICGPYAEELTAGIHAWTVAAGRGGELNIETQCNAEQSRQIKIYDENSEIAQKRCSKFPQAAAVTYVYENLIVICGDISKPKALMLHEAGHLWGMCDVYPGALAGAGNCDGRNKTKWNRDTVMGANYATQLTADDIFGINIAT